MSSLTRGWWLLVVCSSVAAFPGALLSLAYTFYIVEEAPSNLLISLGIVLPVFFNSLSKLWGFLADYQGSRKLFILIGWFSSSLALVIPLIELNLTNVLLASILGAALWSIGSPSLTAEVMKRDRPGTRLGIWRSVGDAFYLMGTLSAGLLYTVLGFRVVLVLCFVMYLATGMAIALLYKPEGGVERKEGSKMGLLHVFIRDLRTSFLGHRALRLSLAVLASWFSIWSIEGLARAKVLVVLGNEILYSLLTTLAAVVEMTLAPLIGKLIDKRGPLWSTMLGLLLLHLATGVALALFNNPIVISIAWVIPFGYILTSSLYIAYGKLIHGLADAVGTCNTLISITALPASISSSQADYVGRDMSILILTLSSAVSFIPLFGLQKK